MLRLTSVGFILATLTLASCNSSPQEKSLTQQLDAALALKDPVARTNRLCSLARPLAEAKEVAAHDRALTAAAASARSIKDPQLRAGMEIKTAAELARAGQTREATKLLGEARETSKQIDDPVLRVRVLTDGALGLAEIPGSDDEAAAFCQEALAIVDRLTEPLAQVRGYSLVAKAAPNSLVEDALSKARNALGQTKEPSQRSLALGEIGLAQHAAGRSEESAISFQSAQEQAKSIEDPDLRASALLALGEMLLSTKQTKDAETILDIAEKAGDQIKSSSDRAAFQERLDKARRKL